MWRRSGGEGVALDHDPTRAAAPPRGWWRVGDGVALDLDIAYARAPTASFADEACGNWRGEGEGNRVGENGATRDAIARRAGGLRRSRESVKRRRRRHRVVHDQTQRVALTLESEYLAAPVRERPWSGAGVQQVARVGWVPIGVYHARQGRSHRRASRREYAWLTKRARQ